MKSLLFLFTAFFFLSLNAQVPDGGILLNASSGTTYQKLGSCTITEETVTGQPFTGALRISVGTDVFNAWDAQVRFPAVAGVQNEDVVLVAFYARTIASLEETGEAQFNVCIEHNRTYSKQLYYKISIGQDWKEYYAPVKCSVTWEADSVSYQFHMGFPSQTFEVADVRFLNYQNTLTLDDLPQTDITYVGQAPDASWRAPAEARINQIRKGQGQLSVYDQQGKILTDASITIRMVQHQFGFGTAIAANTFDTNSTYREKVFELFNEVVFENDLKWPQFNPDASNDHIVQALDSLDAHQIVVRGHNVIWPSFRFTPDHIEEISGDPVALRNAIDSRIDRVSAFTKGRLNDWDVINEPYSEHDIQDILGDEVMADWFKRVRKNDRGVKLYLNDYNILSAGGNNKPKQDYYYNLVEYIDGLGGDVEGIGMQGHFGSDLTPIPKIYNILERFAALNKEIKITEHDIDLTQRNVQADYTRDFMTILFSHPSVRSLLIWGFWEGRHWKPDGALFNEDWTIRPHGQVWKDMIYTQWWTPEFNVVPDDQGKVSFEGFLGTYEYTIVSGETEHSGVFSLDHSNQSGIPNHIVISLDGSIPEHIEITPSSPGFLCQGEEVTLRAPDGLGLSYMWFRNDTLLSDQTSSISTGTPGMYHVNISKNGLDFTSQHYEVVVNELPNSTPMVTGDLSFCIGEHVTLRTSDQNGNYPEWYYGSKRIIGNTDSIQISESGIYSLVTTSNGCSTVSQPLKTEVGTPLEVNIEALGDLTFCEGENVLLRTTPAPGQTYTWENGDSIVLENDFRLRVTESGAYHVSTVNNGCSSSSDTLFVKALPFPEAVINVTGETVFCEGSSVGLIANDGEQLVYLWSRDGESLTSTTKNIEISDAGSYRLTVSNEGCSSISEPVEITVLSVTDPGCSTGVNIEQLSAKVFPNPFNGSFLLTLEAPAHPGTYLQLFDAMGKLVLHQELEPGASTTRIYLINKGVYLLKLSDGPSSQTIWTISY